VHLMRASQMKSPVVLEVRVVTGSGGGPDKTILNSPRYLGRYGYRTVCAYLRPPGDLGFERLRERARCWSAPLVEIDDRGPWDLGVVRSMLALCRSERVAIWHGHDYKSNLLGLVLRRFWPMRLVTTVHGWVKKTRRTPLYYGLDRQSLKFYERVICVSDDLRQTCLAAGVSEDACVLIENAIDTHQYTRTCSVEAAKARLGFSPDRLLIGAIGRLSAEKGFDRLIAAARRLLADGLDFDLVIAGEGDERARLEALIKSQGRPDRIRLLGYRADTIELYQSLDLFALSSLREGLPNVVLEAMALGVPILATRIAGLPRLIQHGRNGWLVEPDDVEGLADGLRRCLEDSAMRCRLGQAGRQTVTSQYDFETRMQKFAALFDELLRRGFDDKQCSTPALSQQL
jgi:glycosyltransferase involved in cell wall biosynthesis